MATTTQVSAYISEETKAEIEAFMRRHSVKKAYLIEEALQHHLQALRKIPEDLIIPSRLVLTDAVPFYSSLGFTPIDLISRTLGDRPEPIAMFLPIGQIAAAAKYVPH